MKIAIRGGHNFQAVGATGLIDETVEDRKVKDSVIKYLKQSGANVLDVTPGKCDVNTDLYMGVNAATNWGADLFISIHFDKCYKSYNGALGHACWVYDTNNTSATIAKRIVERVCNCTGFKNRGIRTNPKLYELRKTSCSAIIVETCFVEATEDVKIYKTNGADKIGKAIAEGILNKTISIKSPNENKKMINKYDETRPTGDNIFPIGKHSYIEETNDGRTILHNDRGNYITIGKGIIDIYWNDNKGHGGHKRFSD